MQAEMLDSTISQNLQDNSSVEYVEPQDDPIAIDSDRCGVSYKGENGNSSLIRLCADVGEDSRKRA